MRRRPIDRTQLSAVLLSIALAVSIVGVVALAPAAADSHTRDEAPQMNEEADVTISEVSQSDHYPGSQNEESASLQYFASGAEAFTEQDAEAGLYIDYIFLDADWIDYSACSIDNTGSFGMDRGNNNEGTNYDDDLVQKQKDTNFRDDGITINFYNWQDFANDPPYMAPEDAIVAQQGEGSTAGSCLTMTDEPGWYRLDGFVNGTVADNGQGQQPSDNAEQIGLNTVSNYFYVCDCDSEEEAREQLGPPPNEGDGTSADSGEGDGTSADGSTGDGTSADSGEGDGTSADGGEGDGTSADGGEGDGTSADAGDGNGTSADGGEGDGTSADAGDGNGTSVDAGEGDGTSADEDGTTGEDNGTSVGEDNGTSDGEDNETNVGGDGPAGQDDGNQTPSANDGPGFGPLVAILALLGSALLLNRRR